MDPFTPQNLVQAIRESGLYPPDKLAALDSLTPEIIADLPKLAEQLFAAKLVTPYQARKVRLNRLSEILFGQYLVLDKIGEGGMGKVYKAAQVRTGRLVALKVVRAQLMSNKTVVSRYKREAAASATLNHPNIVTLLDADEAQGRYFLAMEFVYGSDLSRMVKEFGPLPSTEACEYVRQAALGLQHAHDHNLIHRDIKPSNILVSGERAAPDTGGVATVRLLDMGLVRSLVEDDDASKTELTRDGTVVGTPDYMSPEQAKNSSGVDHRADVYSLGCTLFYLLTGKPPFPDGSPIDKLLRHQLDPPPDVRKQRPDVPFEVVNLVNKMLAKRPEDRVQTAAEVARIAAQYTAAGLASAQDIVFTMPDAPPPVVPVGDTVATPAVKVMEAEVVTRKSAPVPKPAALLKKPVKLVPREADSNDSFPHVGSRRGRDADSDSLPGTGDETRPRSKDTEAAAAAKKRQAKARLANKRRKKPTNWVPLVAAAAGATVLAVVALVFLLKPDPKPTEAKPDPNKNAPPPVAARPPLPPAWLHVPEGATALAVAHPDAYWPAARDSIPAQSRYVKAMNELAAKYQFDLRAGERFTFAYTGGPNHGFAATIEGAFLTPDWFRQVAKTPGAKAQVLDGQMFFTFPSPRDRAIRGCGSAARGYTITNEEHLAHELSRRNPAKTPALADGLLRAIPDAADPTRPTVTFAATGKWQLPDGPTLSELGAELVIINARLVGDRFDVDVEVSGTSKERVQEFVNVSLWGFVNKRHVGVKPYLKAIFENTANDGWDKVGGLDRLTKTEPAAWTIEQVHQWLERLLPE
jgi:serine/threonine-protein kinase